MDGSERWRETLAQIVRREFSKEIQDKERILREVDDKLVAARKCLRRLRYAIVNRYYGKDEPPGDEQRRIHPAVKRILNEDPSVPIDEPPRSLRQKIKPDAATVAVSVPPAPPALPPARRPMYVGPKGLDEGVLAIFPASRNRRKERLRIIVGNTSKYVGPATSGDRVTHRWLLYVRGPKGRPDLSHAVRSITVRLHESYAPQNVVHLKSPPFHLSKRGWGEFPVNLRIHFKNETFNKPVNLIHNLKLDRFHTGLQTLGAETVADVWLYPDETAIDRNAAESDDDSSQILSAECENDTEFKYDDDNSINSNGFNTVDSPKIKEEPMDYEDITDDLVQEDWMPELIKNEFDHSDHIDRDIDPDLQRIILLEHSYSKTAFPREKDELTNDGNAASGVELDIASRIRFVIDLDTLSEAYDFCQLDSIVDCPTINIEKMTDMNQTLVEKICPLEKYSNWRKVHLFVNIMKINKIIIAEYAKELLSMMHRHWNKSLSVARSYVSTMRLAINTNERIATVLSEDTLKTVIDNDLQNIGLVVLSMYEKLFSESLQISDVRYIVSLLLQQMPMTTALSTTVRYSKLFPYSVQNEQVFFSLDCFKRRNLMWTRARMIKNFIKNYFAIKDCAKNTWNTKQIVAFSMFHGYFPITPIENYCKIECEDVVKWQSSRIINTKTSFNMINSILKIKLDTDVVVPVDTYKNSFCYISDSSDEEIQVCDTYVSSKREKRKLNGFNTHKTTNAELLPYKDDTEAMQCRFIEKTCAQIGVDVSHNQNVGHGYTFGLVQKLLLISTKCFAEDLLRRALSAKLEAAADKGQSAQIEEKAATLPDNLTKPPNLIWNISERGIPYEISLNDIFNASKAKSEFDFLTNLGLGLECVEYNENL